MLEDHITSYCVCYDRHLCTSDPERIWRLLQHHGGSVYYTGAGTMDFYVPQHLITQVLLMDSGLRVRKDRSYI